MSKHEAGGRDALRALTPELRELVAKSTVVARAAPLMARRTGMAIDDLIGPGHEALVLAATRWDPSTGVPFDAFVWDPVRFAMLKAAERAQRPLPRLPAKARKAAGDVLELATDTGDVLNDSEHDMRRQLDEFCDTIAGALISGFSFAAAAAGGESAVAEQSDARRSSEMVEQALERMPDYEGRLLRLRFYEDKEFDVIAAELGVSNATVRRHHVAAVSLLSKRLRASGLGAEV